MKVAIIYKSLTGNTKLLAETIQKYQQLGELVYMGEPKIGIDADFYFIGSWTDKGTCSKEIGQYLKTLQYKKIAYFGTAGYGKSQTYYATLFARVKEICDSSNEILDYFYCQGKMPKAIRHRYEMLLTEHPEDHDLQVNLDNFDIGLTHPDQTDLENLKQWVEKLNVQGKLALRRKDMR